jgi:formylglycine-generating enzyme required for sulfatase activity
MGTLDYASPEQKQDGGAADERSDVFALGLVFYEMLTGKRPAPLQVHKVAQPWRDVIAKATEPEPQERHASMDELLTETESARSAVSHEDAISQAMGKDDDLRCPKCRLVNTLEAKFCRACRESLRQPCPACNAQVRTGLKHCDQCTADIKLVRECRDGLATATQQLQEGLVSETASMVQALQQRMRSGALGDAGDELFQSARACLQNCGEQAKQGRELARKAADLEKVESYEEARVAWLGAVRLDSAHDGDMAAYEARLPGLRKAKSDAEQALQLELATLSEHLNKGRIEHAADQVRALLGRLDRIRQPWTQRFVENAEQIGLRCRVLGDEAKLQVGSADSSWAESEFEQALELLGDAARIDQKWSTVLAAREQEIVAASAARDKARAAVEHARVCAREAMARSDVASTSAAIADAKSQLAVAGSRFTAAQQWIAEVEAANDTERVRLAHRARRRRRWFTVLAVLGMAIAGYGILGCFVWWKDLQRLASVDAEASLWGSRIRILTECEDESIRSMATDAGSRFGGLAQTWRSVVERGESGAAEREAARRVYTECVKKAVATEARSAVAGSKLGFDAVRNGFDDPLEWRAWCERAAQWKLESDFIAAIQRNLDPIASMAQSASGLGIELEAVGGSSRSQLVHRRSGIRLVSIQPGAFDMGSASGYAAEKPVHRVGITRPFWMAQTEVTQAQYRAIRGNDPSHFSSGTDADRHPVQTVSWHDAVAFCEAMSESTVLFDGVKYGFRLPTEAEWEYCCRAGTTTDWHTGSSLSSRAANFADAQMERTVAVGSYAANAWGLFDMHGNVWEWCLDAWDGSANYPSSVVSDPYVSRGPRRVFRGGGWDYDSRFCRSAYRHGGDPGGTSYVIGFRVVLAPVLGK